MLGLASDSLRGYREDGGISLNAESTLVGVQKTLLNDGDKSVWPKSPSTLLFRDSDSISILVLVLEGQEMSTQVHVRSVAQYY